MVVLGSGGHTTEMFQLIKCMDFDSKYKPVTFVVASDDQMSRKRLEVEGHDKNWEVMVIKRSRQVGQSYITSIWTTLRSLGDAVLICLRERPSLLICNGPGTCVPLCVALKLISFNGSLIVFVESFCRTKSLSLSGKILYYIADHFLVQWPFLAQKYKRCKYIGLLV
jgi:beta-1,4-N-acetylglucosaminyltransferase